MKVSKLAKTIVAAIGAGVTVLIAAVSDNTISSTEIVNVALAVLTALGVYVVPNAPQQPKGASESPAAASGDE